MKQSALLVGLLCTTILSGCGRIPRGLIYTDTIEPLCRDARGSGLGNTEAMGATKAVEIPLTQIDLSAEWDSRAIGDIAKNHGISPVYGCDLRRESYVIGIWRKDRVIIYGDSLPAIEKQE